MYKMSHLYRTGFCEETQLKNIHITSRVDSVTHHHNIGCVDHRECQTYRVDPKYGYFLHHRIDWKVGDKCGIEESGSDVIFDPIILRYKTKLENNFANILAQVFK